MAKKLNIDEVTVRKRIAKMKRSGFLQGWTVMANPTPTRTETRPDILRRAFVER